MVAWCVLSQITACRPSSSPSSFLQLRAHSPCDSDLYATGSLLHSSRHAQVCFLLYHTLLLLRCSSQTSMALSHDLPAAWTCSSWMTPPVSEKRSECLHASYCFCFMRRLMTCSCLQGCRRCWRSRRSRAPRSWQGQGQRWTRRTQREGRPMNATPACFAASLPNLRACVVVSSSLSWSFLLFLLHFVVNALAYK